MMFSERVSHERAKPIEKRLWHPSAGDLAKLSAAAVKLAEAGGAMLGDKAEEIGLPDEVQVNREHMDELRVDVIGLSQWLQRKRRLASGPQDDSQGAGRD